MSAKKSGKNTVAELENKLKNAQRLNYILITALSAVCIALLVVCIVFASSSCSSGTENDLPAVDTSPAPDAALVSSTDLSVGTYQYVSPDDSYGFAVEFTPEGAVWFYEATKDETLIHGFVGELVPTSDADCYSVPLYYVDFVPYTVAELKIEAAENGQIFITQIDENALLSDRIPFGEAVALTPVEGYSLSQTVVSLYADQMTE